MEIKSYKSSNFVNDIKHMLAQARQKSNQAINSSMVEAYWLMGRRIVEEEQHGNDKANYGDELLKKLSQALTKDLGNGFSYSNLRNFRQFYLTYPDFDICYTVCSKLSWSHNRLIMRVDDPMVRQFYLEEAAACKVVIIFILL